MKTIFHQLRENRPHRLNDQELLKPAQVFEAFFHPGDPNYWKQVLWRWLGSQLTDGYIRQQRTAADKLASLPQEHHQLIKLIEAAWVIHHEQAFHRLRFNGEEIRRLMQATIELQPNPKTYEINKRLYPFYFLNGDERRCPDKVLQNIFLLYDLYDWQTILEEWLIYGPMHSVQADYKNKHVILYVYVQLNKLVEAAFLSQYLS